MAVTGKFLVRTTLFIALTVGLGWLVGEASGSGAGDPWYRDLPKSHLNPPGWVFAVVWPILYTLMAIAAAWLFENQHWNSFRLFLFQLLFNYTWSFVFFSFHQIEAGFVWILILLVLAAGWVHSLWRLNRPLALMQLPYLAWLCFAAYLNGAIMVFNQ